MSEGVIIAPIKVEYIHNSERTSECHVRMARAYFGRCLPSVRQNAM